MRSFPSPPLYVAYEGDTLHVAVILVIAISLLYSNNIYTRALTFNGIPFDDLFIFFFV